MRGSSRRADQAGRQVDERERESSGARARITQAEQLIASESEARATSILQLTAQLTAANSAITGNSVAISGLDTRVTTAEGLITSQASSITALESGLGTAQGAIAGNASAINGLDTRVTSAEGVITAQASAITSLSTTVGGHTTSIGTLTSSVGGLSAQWGVAITTDGVPVGSAALTGVTTLDGTSTSSLVFDVDNFILGKTGESGSFQPMVVWDAVNNRLALNNLLAVNATIGRIRSANDRIDINLDAGYIRITTPDPMSDIITYAGPDGTVAIYRGAQSDAIEADPHADISRVLFHSALNYITGAEVISGTVTLTAGGYDASGKKIYQVHPHGRGYAPLIFGKVLNLRALNAEGEIMGTPSLVQGRPRFQGPCRTPVRSFSLTVAGTSTRTSSSAPTKRTSPSPMCRPISARARLSRPTTRSSTRSITKW